MWSALGLRLALLFAVMEKSGAVDCPTLVMLNMAACLPLITVQNPVESCCLGLKAALETGAECLCQAFTNTRHLGVTINATIALTLSSACHFSHLSITNCGLSVGISDAPEISPSSAISPTSFQGTNGVAPTPTSTLAPHRSSSSTLSTAFKLLLLFIVSNVLFTVV